MTNLRSKMIYAVRQDQNADHYPLETLVAKWREMLLTNATLCDMVLGEDADDRSDDALIRGVGMLQVEVERLREELEQQKLAVEMAYKAAQGATQEACARIADRCAAQYDEEGYFTERDAARTIATIIRDKELWQNPTEC